jgi:hypothetical protein
MIIRVVFDKRLHDCRLLRSRNLRSVFLVAGLGLPVKVIGGGGGTELNMVTGGMTFLADVGIFVVEVTDRAFREEVVPEGFTREGGIKMVVSC